MESSFAIAHRRMLTYEGGYSNHPQDPGGVTLEGIIQTVYDAYRDEKGKPRRALTPQMRRTPSWIAERDDIYRSKYWHPPRCGQLPAGVDAAIYDYSVNSGIGRSRKVLQRLVGVVPDGVIGPDTIAAVAKRDPRELVAAICDERLRFLHSLKTWPVFGAGWGKRVADVEVYATALATGVADKVTVPAPETSGRGTVPEPKTAKSVVKGGTAAGTAAAGGGAWDWVAAHPLETALIAAATIGGVVLTLRLIDNLHRAKQETPMPVAIVPEKTS